MYYLNIINRVYCPYLYCLSYLLSVRELTLSLLDLTSPVIMRLHLMCPYVRHFLFSFSSGFYFVPRHIMPAVVIFSRVHNGVLKPPLGSSFLSTHVKNILNKDL